MPDGTIEPVTTFSYLKYKLKLYEISSPIIGDLYFHRGSNVANLAAKVSRIHEELVNWFNALPPELKLEDLFRGSEEPVSSSTRPFMLQALALQIAYDNVQILLHRPLLSQNLQSFKTNSGMHEYSLQENALRNGGQMLSEVVHQILLSSRDHCWDSAIRSSKLGRYHQCLVSARDSHAAAFLGINLFTAGMVLCVVALSRPLSSQAQMAKQAVSRIMSLSRFLSGKVLLSAQTTKILKDLVRLIGEKEIKAMLSGSDTMDALPISNGLRSTELAAPAEEKLGATSDPQGHSRSLSSSQVAVQPDNESVLVGVDPEQIFMDNFDFSGFENMDFNNGLATLQQGNPKPRTGHSRLDLLIC